MYVPPAHQTTVMGVALCYKRFVCQWPRIIISLSDFENSLKEFMVSPDNFLQNSPYWTTNGRTPTWTSPDGKTHSQVDHIFIDRRRHSSILDVRYFREADSDSDHDGVIAKVRERLAVSKQKFNLERFYLSNLSSALVNGVMNLRVL